MCGMKVLRELVSVKDHGAQYYINNKETTALLENTGAQIPGMLVLYDGFVNSIDSANSPVKRKIGRQTGGISVRLWRGEGESPDNGTAMKGDIGGYAEWIYRTI